MADDPIMFDGWSDRGRAIAEQLRPMLCQQGVEFYEPEIDKEVRAGFRSGRKPWIVATLRWQPRNNGVKLALRAGRQSGFIGSGALLDQDLEKPDFGHILITSSEIPEELNACIDSALAFTIERRGNPAVSRKSKR